MAEKWLELSWVVPNKLIQILGAELYDLGALGLQEDYLPGEEPPPRQPWETDRIIIEPSKRLLKVWFPLGTDIGHALRSLCAQYPSAGTYSWSILGNEDWDQDWKQHFQREVFSEYLAVAPPWQAQEGDLVIEPGLAFGTGNHPTTHTCLKAIAQWAQPGKKCLDIGCGTGILALAAAKLGMDVYGIDIEADAIHAARENAHHNNLTASFDDTPIEDVSDTYDIVVANLYAEVLVALSAHIIPRVNDKLALAGILHDRAHLVKAAFSEFCLLKEMRDGDWTHLWYSK